MKRKRQATRSPSRPPNEYVPVGGREGERVVQPSEAPLFRPRPPWWGGDLQTLRNSLLPAPRPPAGERLYLAMADGSGDRLWALYNAGSDIAKPLVILIHGLAGCEDSSYIIAATKYFLGHGYATLRLNLRGAGPSRPTCTLQSHAGRSQDLRDAIQALPPATIAQEVVVLGFSLSGNMSLKFAAEYGRELPIRALATVSAPIDLAVTSANMLRRRNRFYNRKLLRDFCRECLAPGAAVSPAERAAIKAARNFMELDDNFVAPRNGYRDVYDYWESCQAMGFLAEIKLPTLVLHAHDDPIVPIDPCLEYPWRDNSYLFPELSRSGGHVGFHGVGNRLWHLDRVLNFLTQMP